MHAAARPACAWGACKHRGPGCRAVQLEHGSARPAHWTWAVRGRPQQASPPVSADGDVKRAEGEWPGRPGSSCAARCLHSL